MKKIYALFLFLSFHSYFCQAQAPEDDNGSRVEVVKMAYITRELDLTPQEAQNFWPVYNNYVNEIKQARNQNPNDEVAFEKKVVEIKEHYQGNFKKVLGNNSQRVNKVYTTDKQFNNTLRNELKNRQQKRVQNNQSGQKPLQQPSNKPNNIKRGNGNPKRPRPPL
ncbi:MAG: hypothetical protein ABJA35_06770 [Parafilimonas sp.]